MVKHDQLKTIIHRNELKMLHSIISELLWPLIITPVLDCFSYILTMILVDMLYNFLSHITLRFHYVCKQFHSSSFENYPHILETFSRNIWVIQSAFPTRKQWPPKLWHNRSGVPSQCDIFWSYWIKYL